MTYPHNARTDKLLARALMVGGALAFALILLGSILLAANSVHAQTILRLGVIVLMSTPIARIALAIVAFWLERDYKYTAVASAVLLIVLLGAVLRVAV